LIQKKKLKKYLKIYRENVLNEKVKEEIIKKNIDIFKINNNKINDNFNINFINENNNKSRNNKNETLLNKYKDNSINNTIFEEKNENDEEFNTINNKEEEKIILRGKKKYLNKNNKCSLLKNIMNRKIDLEDKYNLNLLSDNFKKWLKNVNNYKKPKIKFNLHSPDMEIRGNKSKKKHIKVKYSRAITSKTSIGSIKSDAKSNSSSIHTKKMRIRNIVVNPSEYLTTTLINNNPIYNKNINKKNKRIIKLLLLIDKIDNNNMIFKCFKHWKNKKK